MFCLKRLLGNYFQPCVCLVPTENWVKLKLLYTLTIKNPFSPVKPFQFLFYFQLFYTSHTILTRSSHALTDHTLSPSSAMTTHQRERETESSTLSLMLVRAPPSPSRQSELHPQSNERRQSTHLCAGEFPSLFEWSLMTSSHLRSTQLRPAVTLPHADEAIPTSYISDPSRAKPSSQNHPQSLTISSSSHQLYHVYVVNKCFFFFFWFLVLLSVYFEIFCYKICLEAKKMWKFFRKIAFSKCYETRFPDYFHCRTKHLDFIFLTGIHFPMHSFYTRNSIYIELNTALETQQNFLIFLQYSCFKLGWILE